MTKLLTRSPKKKLFYTNLLTCVWRKRHFGMTSPDLTSFHLGGPMGLAYANAFTARKVRSIHANIGKKNTIDMYKHIKTQYDSLCILSGWWNACHACRKGGPPNPNFWSLDPSLQVAIPLAPAWRSRQSRMFASMFPELCIKACDGFCADTGDTQNVSQVWKSQNQGFLLKAVKYIGKRDT